MNSVTKVSIEEIAKLKELAEKAENAPWAVSENLDEVWGGMNGDRVRRVLSVKLPVSGQNLAYIGYANPERILRLLSLIEQSTGFEEVKEQSGVLSKPLDFACYLLAMACQRHHCNDCFLPHKEKWCPKAGNEGRATLESVSQAEWYTFLKKNSE